MRVTTTDHGEFSRHLITEGDLRWFYLGKRIVLPPCVVSSNDHTSGNAERNNAGLTVWSLGLCFFMNFLEGDNISSTPILGV